jgi:hypothetical protein
MKLTELRSRIALAPDPGQELRRVVERLAHEGSSRDVLYAQLEELLFDVRTDPNQGLDEDIVLDVMDALEGWCHPAAKIIQ